MSVFVSPSASQWSFCSISKRVIIYGITTDTIKICHDLQGPVLTQRQHPQVKVIDLFNEDVLFNQRDGRRLNSRIHN